VSRDIGLLSADSSDVVGSMEKVADTAKQSAAESQESAAANEEQFAMMEEIAKDAEGLLETANDLRSGLARFRL